MMWQGWINIAVGIWLIIAGLIPALRTPASLLIPGIIAIIIGFWAASRNKSWQGTVNGIIGIWLVLSSIWFMLAVPWNFIIFGIIVAVLAIWNVVQHPHPGNPVQVKTA